MENIVFSDEVKSVQSKNNWIATDRLTSIMDNIQDIINKQNIQTPKETVF